MLIQGSGFEVQGEKRLIKSEEHGAINSMEQGARSREQRAWSVSAWSKEQGAWSREQRAWSD
jgi:hypothetical protein